MAELTAGVYERLVTGDLARRLQVIDGDLVHTQELADEEVLVKHLAGLTRRALAIVGEQAPGDAIVRQTEVANRISAAVARIVADSVAEGDQVPGRPEMLLEIAAGRLPDGRVPRVPRPDIPLVSSALLVNGRQQPQIGREVIKELASADRVDLLCAFVKWHGLRLVEEALSEFLARGGELRVITTTYMGATEKRALDRLVEMGAQVSVSYDTQRTRLHAKAWLFRRNSGLDTAYVGSSNLSRSAMLDGVEWNVRLAHAEQPHLIDTFAATFEEYWNEPSFEPYDPRRDGERFEQALRAGDAKAPELRIANIDVVPYPYQQVILDELEAVREVHGHRRNLVVMATGTGKTIVAALDYRRLRAEREVESLLFVAHTKDILMQARAIFRLALRDGSFGELFVDGERPGQWRHVFGSIQSLRNLTDLQPDQFDMVIMDEFHHAAADSYAGLLDRLRPKILLGLTATPERTDGQDILHWFDDARPAVELRLWEALERGLLVPFHYFGVHDDVDLSSVSWRNGGYDLRELENLYTGLDTRVNLVVQALRDKLGDLSRMKAVGFCVSIKHAQFMADRFRHRGIPAEAITSAMSTAERERVRHELKNGTVKAVFTVDLFNEGVDVPDIDTILFLRPTESATVFLQQLGRGLRLTSDKPVLTVLDFVGHQHKRFRFDRKFTAVTGIRRTDLADEVDKGFPTLPAGCAIDLDREVSKAVLTNIKQALTFNRKEAMAELRKLGTPSLREFLAATGRELEELYGGTRGGWARLFRDAGLDTRPVIDPKADEKLGKAIGQMLHFDDPERLDFLRDLLDRPEPPRRNDFDDRGRRRLAMLHSVIDSSRPVSVLEEDLAQLWRVPARRDELRAVVDVLFESIHRVTPVVPEIGDLPIQLHARYRKDELLAAFGFHQTRAMVEGVRWAPDHQADIFMVSIDKSGKGFKPQTMYADQAITPTLFQWESQNRTEAASETGQRYIHHAGRGSTVHLFLRENKKGAPPFLYAGPMTYVSHTGDRPMRILWELAHPLPGDVFHYAKVTTG